MNENKSTKQQNTCRPPICMNARSCDLSSSYQKIALMAKSARDSKENYNTAVINEETCRLNKTDWNNLIKEISKLRNTIIKHKVTFNGTATNSKTTNHNDEKKYKEKIKKTESTTCIKSTQYKNETYHKNMHNHGSIYSDKETMHAQKEIYSEKTDIIRNDTISVVQLENNSLNRLFETKRIKENLFYFIIDKTRKITILKTVKEYIELIKKTSSLATNW